MLGQCLISQNLLFCSRPDSYPGQTQSFCFRRRRRGLKRRLRICPGYEVGSKYNNEAYQFVLADVDKVFVYTCLFVSLIDMFDHVIKIFLMWPTNENIFISYLSLETMAFKSPPWCLCLSEKLMFI